VNGIASVVITHKFNSRHILRAGAYTTGKSFDLAQRETVSNLLRDKVKSSGDTRLTNVFAQWKWNITNRVSLLSGLHAQQFALNATSVLEPRFGFRWVGARIGVFGWRWFSFANTTTWEIILRA
jgi:hypothetical protein